MAGNRTFPNVFWILVNLILILFLSAVVVFMTFAFLKNSNYGILFPLILVLSILVVIYIQLSNHFSFVIINQDGIRIVQPLKLKKINLKWENIKGYSTSEFWYGKNLYKSKSFIIYSKTKEATEIIKLYNLKFDETVSSLKNYQIQQLGSEPYQTGIWKRKYKFNV
jgi:hypothetical protein